MRETLDPPLLDERQERADIDPRRLKQHLAQRPPLFRWKLLARAPTHSVDDLAHEREAVAVDARAGEPKHHIARRNVCARQHLVPLDRADAESGEVVIAAARTCPAFRLSRRRSTRSRRGGSLRRSTRRPRTRPRCRASQSRNNRGKTTARRLGRSSRWRTSRRDRCRRRHAVRSRSPA